MPNLGVFEPKKKSNLSVFEPTKPASMGDGLLNKGLGFAKEMGASALEEVSKGTPLPALLPMLFAKAGEKIAPPAIGRELASARGFMTFPRDIVESVAEPLIAGKPKEAGQAVLGMGKDIGTGVLDWIMLGAGSPVEKQMAMEHIGGRVKERGFVAESVYPMTLLAPVLKGIGMGKKAGVKTEMIAERLEDIRNLPTEQRLETIRRTELPSVRPTGFEADLNRIREKIKAEIATEPLTSEKVGETFVLEPTAEELKAMSPIRKKIMLEASTMRRKAKAIEKQRALAEKQRMATQGEGFTMLPERKLLEAPKPLEETLGLKAPPEPPAVGETVKANVPGEKTVIKYSKDLVKTGERKLKDFHQVDLLVYADRAKRAGDLETAQIFKQYDTFLREKHKPVQVDISERISAAKEMATEIRQNGGSLKVNPDGSVTIYHGTSKVNAEAIRQSGKLDEMTFFSHSKSRSMFGSEGAKDYAKMAGRGKGEIMEFKVDPRDIDFNSGSGEIEAPKPLVRGDDGIWRAKNRKIKPIPPKSPVLGEGMNKMVQELKDKDVTETPPTGADYPDLAKAQETGGIKKEVITPTEELSGGFGVVSPFKSKNVQLGNALREAMLRKKIKQEADMPAPRITMDIKPEDARTFLHRPSYKYDVVPDEYGEVKIRYGETAGQAQRLLMLTERNIRVDQGRGAAEIGGILKQSSKSLRTKYNNEIVDGLENPIEVTEAKNIPEPVKQVVRGLKAVSDRQRQEIITTKREDIRPYFTRLSEQLYRQENGLKGKRLTPDQRVEIANRTETMIKGEIPDSWGIKDYFRHLHLGDYALLKDGEYIGSAQNWSEALQKIVDNYVENPTTKNYDIKLREFINPDVVRVSRKRQYKILNDLRKELNEESPDRIREVLSGKIGAREAQRKWAGFLQERKGAPGYSKDLEFVLNYHNNQYHRWKNLYRLQSQIQPLITKLTREGRPLIAEEIKTNLKAIWGQKTPTSAGLDSYLNKIFRGKIRPFALERWAGRIRNVLSTGMLKTSLRYNLLNSLQTLQTGMVVPYRELAWAQKAVRTVEGKALLDRHGVYYLTGRTAGELTRQYTSPQFRSGKLMRILRLSPETSNQVEMWLAVYKHGIDNLGMTDAQAGDYAFLRGMVYSQFYPLKTNIPRALRPELVRIGPGMFRQFTIGSVELGADLAKQAFGGKGQYTFRQRLGSGGRLAHFVAAQLALGGARILTGPAGKIGTGYLTFNLYNKIKDKYGETIAKVINYGLPALINSDWSSSIQMFDLPYSDNVPEAIGQVVLGPVGSIGTRIVTEAKREYPTRLKRILGVTKALGESFGGTRQLIGLEKVLTGDYDFRSPSGKLKFQGELKDALVQLYGSRPVTASIEQMKMDALTEVFSQRNETINRAKEIILQPNGDYDALTQIIEKYNSEWPELAIGFDEVKKRTISSMRQEDLSAFERMLKQKGKRFQNMFQAGK